MISIILPVYNEEKILIQNQPYFQRLSRKAELIFVDAESSDRSAEIAKSYGRVLTSGKNRSLQMNYGAGYAARPVLLFLHADSRVSEACLNSIEERLTKENFIGGCLAQQIDKKGLVYRILEGFGNLRARITKVFYGDQGIFVRKDIFLKLGGFPETPIMEDVLFTKKLRRQGRTIVLQDKIIVSARRWEKQGIAKTALLYSLINILFKAKVPAAKIKILYDDLR